MGPCLIILGHIATATLRKIKETRRNQKRKQDRENDMNRAATTKLKTKLKLVNTF